MEKRYQVFLSSTFTDLRAERQQVIQALLELDCIPAGMELFSASDADQWRLIEDVIDHCDYYVVIIGGRYGSITEEGISFTEREFDHAVKTNKPILAFLHQEPEQISLGKSEQSDSDRKKLAEFRTKTQTGRHCKYWSSPEDLGGKVSRSLVKAMKTHPAEGWIRGRFAATPELLNQVNELRAANEILQESADVALAQPPNRSNEFAGGTDTAEVFGVMEVGDDKVAEDWSVQITWDQIFGQAAPTLYTPCSEATLRSKLATSFRQLTTAGSTTKVHSFDLSDESFDAIKTQLFALGLMTLTHLMDVIQYWILTPYGRRYHLELSAVKRETVVSALNAQAIPKVQK